MSINLVDADAQLERLYDYTKFHIGLYTTVMGGVVAILVSDKFRRRGNSGGCALAVGAVLFALAGLCGGVVAASTPDALNYSVFMATQIGPLGWNVFLPATWICGEHLAFWAGVIFVLLGVKQIVEPSSNRAPATAQPG